MTIKLTIKDLNCENCANKNKPACPIIKEYQEGCRSKSEKHEIRVIHKIMEYHSGNIKNAGCASHPLALQVLAGPVIEELERRAKQAEAIDGKGMLILGYTKAIKLIEDGVKEP